MQAWVLYNKETRHVCVSFRGTEQTKLKDIVTDLNFIPCDFEAERTTSLFFAKDQMQVCWGITAKGDQRSTGHAKAALASRSPYRLLGCCLPQVHGGFLDAYDSVKVKLLTIVDSLTGKDGAPEEWTVYVTGHSLGGALATLFSMDLARRCDALADGSTTELLRPSNLMAPHCMITVALLSRGLC